MNKQHWKYKKIGDICDIKTGKLDANAASLNGVYPFFTCSKETLCIDRYSYDCECVLIAGNGDLNVKYYNGKFDAYQRTYIVTIKPQYKSISTYYLYKFFCKYIERLRQLSIGGVIKYIKLGNLTDACIPVPPIGEQERIVAELDLLQGIIEKKKEQLKAYDQLAQSIFYTMFGDPIDNPKGWETKKLGEFASFKNGLNYHPKEDGLSILCIGVADFQNRNELRDFENIRNVTIDEMVDESYYLKDGDIIIVRSNGSKELVGRNMIVYPNLKNVTYSGFCIRCRLSSSSIQPTILSRILSDKSTMTVLRQEGRGCNISNINQKILSSLQIILPPLSLQQEFAEKVEAIERQKALVQQSIEETQTMFDYTMDKYFG